MKCLSCSRSAVMALQHGSLCPAHFIDYFEEKVFKTIKKYRMIDRNDTLCIAASGGKDSQTLLYLTQKYLRKQGLQNQFFALAIDEGIEPYRHSTLEDLKQFCRQQEIPLHLVEAKREFGFTLDQ